MSVLDSVFTPDFIAGLRPDISEPWQYLHWVFVDTDDHQDWSSRQLDKLGRLLNLAQRHDQLDDDTIRRLTSPDAEQFWGRLNELKVAEFLESRGLAVRFGPQGRKSHKGEFLVSLPSREVFVEVKTMFPRLPEKALERHLNRLSRAAAKVDIPAWLNVQVLQEPTRDFQTNPFVQFLSEALPALMKGGTRSQAVIYEDGSTGLRVAIKFMSGLRKGPLLASPFTGVREVRDDEYIKTSLKKASSQLPDDLPCMVILCSHLGYPPTPTIFHNALYGRFGALINWGHGNEPKIQSARREDGFFARGSHSRLSVVGLLDDFQMKRPPHIDIYHHPCSKFPLHSDELLVISDRQWCAEEVLVSGSKGLTIWQPYHTDDETE